MRQLIAALVLAPGLAAAQSVRPLAEPSQTPSLPALGLYLAPLALPLPPIGLPPAYPTPTLSPPAPATSGYRAEGARRPGWTSPAVVYVVPGYGWESFGATPPAAATSPAPAPSAPVATAAAAASPVATGTLRLDFHPAPTGQLFVEGAFVGTLDELGSELTFAVGTHRLEIRERGYEPFTLAVRIAAGRDLVYRGALTKLADPAGGGGPSSPAAAPAPAAPPSPVARKVFYFIPGCYLGDVPPTDAGLPATCDHRRAVIFHP